MQISTTFANQNVILCVCSTKESKRTRAIDYDALQHLAAKSPAIDKKSGAIDGKPAKINSTEH